jgi:hypothetical protein
LVTYLSKINEHSSSSSTEFQQSAEQIAVVVSDKEQKLAKSRALKNACFIGTIEMSSCV